MKFVSLFFVGVAILVNFTAEGTLVYFVSSSLSTQCLRPFRTGGGEEGTRPEAQRICVLNGTLLREVWEIADFDAALDPESNGSFIYSLEQTNPVNPKLLTEDENPRYLILRGVDRASHQKWRLSPRSASFPDQYHVINTYSGRCIVPVNYGFADVADCTTSTTAYWNLINATLGDDAPPVPPVPDPLAPVTEIEVAFRDAYNLGNWMAGTYYWNVTMKPTLDLDSDKAQVWKVGNWDRLKSGTTIVLVERFGAGLDTEIGVITQRGNSTFVREAQDGIGPTPPTQLWRVLRDVNGGTSANDFYIRNVGTNLCLGWIRDPISSKYYLETGRCSGILWDRWAWQEIAP